jgi:hypothetical protein
MISQLRLCARRAATILPAWHRAAHILISPSVIASIIAQVIVELLAYLKRYRP